jgi:methyl-accepting chemotaxis protein
MNTWNELSLKWKQLALYLLVGLIPLLIVSIVNSISFEKIKSINASQFQTTAEDIADKIDRNLFERYGDVQAFGLNTILRNRDLWYQPKSQIVDAMNSYVDTYDIYYFTLLVDLEGKVIAVNDKDQDGNGISTGKFYGQNFKNTEWFRNVVNQKFYTSQEGNVGGNSGFTGTVIYPLHRNSDVQSIYSGDDGLTIGFVAPVYDANGTVIAVWHNYAKHSLVEEFFIEAWKSLKKKGLGATELTLLDQEGNIIVDHDPALGRGTESGVQHNFDVLMKLNLAEKGVGAAVKAVANENGFMYANHARKKINQAAGYAHHKGALGFPGMNWSVLVRAPEEVVNAPLINIENNLLLITGGCIVLIVLLGRWSANKVVTPVLSLISELKKFSDGNIKGIEPLKIDSKDEFQQLDNSFVTLLNSFKEFMKTTTGLLDGSIQSLDSVSVKGEFKRELDEMLEQANETNKIKTMVENSPSITLLANKDLELDYINPATKRFLKQFESEFNFDSDNLTGQSINIFHKNQKMREVLSNPSNLPHKAIITVGSETVEILASAVYDQSNNYIGPMVTWEVLTERLKLQDREKHVMSQVQEMSQTLAGASEELTATSSQLTSNAEQTSSEANEVALICNEVSENVQTVAAGTQEMGISIKEIAQNSNEAARITSEAVQMAGTTNTTISNLGTASAEISEVVKVITSIAEQTNLLALNATIEAARAGEMGKGFAVVANEVKELAKETSKATEDISQKIAGIQDNTKEAVDAIGSITQIITQINDISSTIASAVEEQSATTNEMGRNVSNAAEGSQKITERISEVTSASANTTAGANDTQMAAADLSKLANNLQELVQGS